jgi:hypothetical protein
VAPAPTAAPAATPEPATAPAFAAPPAGPSSALDSSFRYQTPQVAHRWRGVAWSAAYLGLQLGFYALNGSPTAAQYDEKIRPADKLFHGAWSLDANSIRTNFVGHPIEGALFHQMARGSRLPVWEAALWSVAGATAWELIEFREYGSLNDLVVTPVGGVALGEPLFQLGAHLDRMPRTTGRTVLAWVVSPWKKLDDLVDGAKLDRGDPADRLETSLWGEAGQARGGWTRGQVGLGLAWRLVRDPDYGAAGHDRRAWVAGEVTGLSLGGAFSGAGLDEGHLESWALLAASYARAIDEGRRGGDLLAGAGVALDLRRHAWVEAGPADLLAMVHVPRLHAEARWLSGELTLVGRLDASLAFGGVRSFALDQDPAAVPPGELPTVQTGYDYHFAVGPAVRPALAARWRGATLEGSFRGDWLRPVLEPDPTPGAHPTARLEDRWTEVAARAAWRFAGGLELGARADWRGSSADAVTATAEDRRVALTVGWIDGG